MDGNIIISSEMNLLLVPELKQFNIYPQYLSLITQKIINQIIYILV